MTTKTLYNTYASGYTIASAVTELNVYFGALVESVGLIDTSKSVSINNSGSIIAQAYGAHDNGIYLKFSGTVINDGSIFGYDGVKCGSSGSVAGWVDNYYGREIGAYNYGILFEKGGTVLNSGSIFGDDSFGVRIFGGSGAVANSGTIEGGFAGVEISSGTVTNSRIIYGYFGSGTGVILDGGGSLTNGSATDRSAVAYGHYGVRAYGGDVNNFASIVGLSLGVVLSGATLVNGGAGDAAALVEGPTGILAIEASTVTNLGTVDGLGLANTDFGALFEYGGTITNGSQSDRNALIEGYGGAKITGAAGTLSNLGTIEALGLEPVVGVYLGAGGLISNGSQLDTTALIEGYTGIELKTAGAVENLGTVIGEARYGVYLAAGGTVANGEAGVASTATIKGSVGVASVGAVTVYNYGTVLSAYFGVLAEYGSASAVTCVFNGNARDKSAYIVGEEGLNLASGSASVTNFGTIFGTEGPGVFDAYGGVIVNGGATDTTALIEGFRGVLADAPTTVTNSGTIDGTSADGVELTAGGTISNGASGNIHALIEGQYGVALTFGGSVSNLGTIFGVAAGVEVYGAAVAVNITNGSGVNRTALIQGYTGILIADAASGEVRNFGTVSGGGGGGTYGVEIVEGPSFQNGSATNSTALVEGYGGVELGSVGQNFGTILALGNAAGAGANLVGGILTNGASGHSSALIEGYTGVTSASASQLINFGTIIGEGGTAVDFSSRYDALTVEAGSTFIGSIIGGGGILELGSATGTLTGLLTGGDVTVSGSMATTTFTDFGTVAINAGASFTLAGNPTIAAGQGLDIDGLATTTGTLTVAGALDLAGTLAGTGNLTLTGAAAFDAGTDLTIAKVNETGVAAIAGFYATSLTVSDVWDQTAGTVSAGAGDKVAFTGTGDVFSGTLAGAGTIDFTGGSDTLSGTHLTATSVVINGASVTLSGSVVLGDTVSVTSPDLTVAAGGATLSGTGSLSLTTTTTNEIEGGPLTNASRILGAGLISVTSLVNSGTIQASSADALTVTTGTTTLVSSGLIESTSTGGLTITGALSNTGSVEAIKGTISVDGSVSGAGTVKLDGGTVDLAGAFSGAVDYLAAGGVLVLAHSKTDTVTVTGFPKTSIGSIDLQDINFTGATETFSGTTTSGTLTIKNGANIATITLEGNYMNSTFTLSADSSGGTIVTDPVKTAAGPPPLQPLVSAIASFGASAGGGGSHRTLHTPDRIMPLLASAA